VLSLTATPFDREGLSLHQAGVDDETLIVHLRTVGEIWICAKCAGFGGERKGNGLWKRAGKLPIRAP
jgi:hypothetical protein